MNIMQLIAFTWVIAWVLCQSFFPDLPHEEMLKAAGIASGAIAFMNNVHGKVWQKIKRIRANG